MNREELLKLADLLDSRGEHVAADYVDSYLRDSFGAEDNNITIRAELSPEDKSYIQAAIRIEDELISLQSQLETLKDFLPSEMDRAGATLQRAIENYKVTLDQFIFDKTSSSNYRGVFEKLSSVADQLDSAGHSEAADRIDGFLKKYSEEVIELGDSDILPEPDSLEQPLPGVEEAGDDEKEKLPGFGESAEEELSNAAKRFKDNPTDENQRLLEEAMETYQNMHDSGDEVLAANSGENVVKKAGGEQSQLYNSDYHRDMQMREPKTDRVDREGYDKKHSVPMTSMSSRYCPDHIGYQLYRVTEVGGPELYQCPLDGHIYSWQEGWADFEGNTHPGGSVAAQTPDSTHYDGGHRIFDSRNNILNPVN